MDIFNDWFFWAITSTLIFGLHAFFYRKLVAEHADMLTAQIVLASIVALFSAIAVSIEVGSIADDFYELIMVAGLQGMLFFMSTTSRLDALKVGLPSHILFPMLKLSTFLVVLISVVVLQEKTFQNSPANVIGVVLILVSTWILMQWKPPKGASIKGIYFAVLATFLSAGAMLTSRYVYENDVSIFAFMLISNMMQMLIGMIVMIATKSQPDISGFKQGLKSGFVIGVLSFAGFSCFLLAIKFGDLSRVAAINTLYVLIPIILSIVLYKEERFSFRKQVAVILSVVGVLMLK